MHNPYDHLLIFLSEKGHGDWSDFLKAVKVLELEDSSFGLARRLCSLAHLDFDFLGNKSWNMATPCLVLIPAERKPARAVLVGKRNPALLDSLEDQAHQVRASIRSCEQTRAPSVVEISAADKDDLVRIAWQTGICFVRQAAWAISLVLPPLDALVTQIPKDPGLFGEVDSFDFDRLRWKRLSREERGIVVDGVFRYGPPFNKGHTICVAGEFFRVEAETGIWWWLKKKCQNVMRYDQNCQELGVPFFADLPILWSRALILASGLLPEIRNSYRIYLNIPLNLAQHVAEQMGQTWEEVHG